VKCEKALERKEKALEKEKEKKRLTDTGLANDMTGLETAVLAKQSRRHGRPVCWLKSFYVHAVDTPPLLANTHQSFANFASVF